MSTEHCPDIARAVGDALDRLAPAGPIGIAVSGGGDSIALLECARLWAHGDRQLFAATVDHRLRQESRAEAESVARFCASRLIPHEILSAGALDGPGNLSAMAREARYRALSVWAVQCGAEAVLLGHTLDDQAETVLMRLARGSGAEGLSGMAESREWLGLKWLRPMLSVRRADLRSWLRVRQIDWSDDPTNEDLTYDRVKARQALATLASLGIDAEGLARTADRLRRQRAVLEDAMARLAVIARCPAAGGGMQLDRNALVEAIPDTALRLLADSLMRVGGRPYRPRYRSLEALFGRIQQEDQFRATLAGCRIAAQGGVVSVLPEHGDDAH